MLTEQQRLKKEADVKPKEISIQADDLIKVRQLRSKKIYDHLDDDEEGFHLFLFFFEIILNFIRDLDHVFIMYF
jgi:hypothetical protein